jgi:hypoxanthine phosphoribosyltransferase
MEMRPGQVLVGEDEIRRRVEELGAAINDTYGGRPLTLVGVLDGCVLFFGDLIRRLRMPVTIGFAKVSTYGDSTSARRAPAVEDCVLPPVSGRHVLVVDDIYDTGATLAAIVEAVRRAGAISVRTAVFVEKERPHEHEVHIDFVGVRVPDVFVVGYGLDYAGRYRNLPYIAELEGFDEPRTLA